MSNEQRTDIPKSRAIRAKMTPGPWSVEESSERDGDELLYRDLSIPEIGRSLHNDEWADVKDWRRDRANAEGIVYCVNTYDALVDEVEALRAALADIPKSRAIRAKMTPGEWQTRFLYRLWRSARRDPSLLFGTKPEADWDDCEGIVYCVNTYDALVDEVEALRAALAEAERAEKNEHAQRMRAEAKLARIQETRDTWNANSDKYKKLHVADVVADLDRALADKGTPHE